jgi:thiosulfate dehydrogenase (quinone) large subunit
MYRDLEAITMATTIHRSPPIAAPVGRVSEPITTGRPLAYVLAGLRVVVGFMFLWAFLDRLFGLGYPTVSEQSWINGGSPTKGFLSTSTGAFQDFYTSIAGDGWVDWVFMIGLAGIGVALLLGIGMRIAATVGAILLLMIWSVILPPVSNPVVDWHFVGALVIVVLAMASAGDTIGLGRWWKAQPFVQRNRWLI